MAKLPSHLRYVALAGFAVAVAACVPVAWRQTGQFIARLESDRFARSVEHLLADSDACLFMTARKFGQEDLPELLHNRHCVDVIQAIAALGEGEREPKCREVFDQLLGRHTAAVRRSLGHLESRSSPRNTQSLKLSELGVCTAMLATALYGETGTLLSQFSALDGFRDEIDRRLAENAHRYPRGLPVAVNTRIYYVPDNRFQLNVLAIHAAQLADAPAQRASEICALVERGETWINGAPRTSWFEMPRRLDGVPTVTTRAGTRYLLYDWVGDGDYDDQTQRLLVDELRESLWGPLLLAVARGMPTPEGDLNRGLTPSG